MKDDDGCWGFLFLAWAMILGSIIFLVFWGVVFLIAGSETRESVKTVLLVIWFIIGVWSGRVYKEYLGRCWAESIENRH
jgi:hypothetical protein